MNETIGEDGWECTRGGKMWILILAACGGADLVWEDACAGDAEQSSLWFDVDFWGSDDELMCLNNEVRSDNSSVSASLGDDVVCLPGGQQTLPIDVRVTCPAPKTVVKLDVMSVDCENVFDCGEVHVEKTLTLTFD